MANLKDVAQYLIILSGIACTMSILISLVKLLLNSDDSPIYYKRIKNSLIALILILTIVNIVNLTQKYFSSAFQGSDFGIGKINPNIEVATIDDTFKDNSKDVDGREVVFINNYKFVVVRTKSMYISEWKGYFYVGTLGTFESRNGYYLTNILVDELVPFADAQGFWKGTQSEIKALRLHKVEYESNTNKNPDDYTKPFDSKGNSNNVGKLVINNVSDDENITLDCTEIYNYVVQTGGLVGEDISKLNYPY